MHELREMEKRSAGRSEPETEKATVEAWKREEIENLKEKGREGGA